jgi:hypothetical protein
MYIMVAGTGKSSRVNTESLIDDYLYKHKDPILVLPIFRSAPTEPQIHAAQMFSDKGYDIIVVGKEDIEIDGIAKANFSASNDILNDAFSVFEGQSEGVFILWNDDDPLSEALLAKSKDMGIKAVDLTNGLVSLVPSLNIKTSEETEYNISAKEELIDVNESEEDDEETDEFDEATEIYNGVAAIVDMFARAVALEVVKLLK